MESGRRTDHPRVVSSDSDGHHPILLATSPQEPPSPQATFALLSKLPPAPKGVIALLMEGAAWSPSAADVAHLSTKDPGSARRAAGSNLAKSLSKMLTDMALPICFPSWGSETATWKPSAGVVIACNLIISVLFILRPRFVTQWPPPRLQVRHGAQSNMGFFMRFSEESQSMTQGSLNGSRPWACKSWRTLTTLALAVPCLSGGSIVSSTGPVFSSKNFSMLGIFTGSGNLKV
mmetsp:Transcript_41571/g.104465  ORF Transcript_41571/g.104465 Transcript_41571/m.104465 type:complete len:233 (-) Transcript_41571:580-1278(-)